MRRCAAVTLATFILLFVLFLGTTPLTRTHPDFGREWDHRNYIAMATAPGSPLSNVAPYSWRVLTPAIARVLPFDVQDSFRLITFAGLWATMIALWYLIKAHGLTDLSAAFGVLLFASMGAATTFNLYDFWLCDPLLFLSITLALLSIQRGNAAAFATVLLIGTLNKETILAVIPLWFTLRPRADWRRGAFAVVPAVAVLVALRLLIPHDNQYSLVNEAATVLALRKVDIMAWTWGTFGAAVLLPLLAPKRAARFLLPYAPFLLLVYAQLLVAINTERLLVAAAPVVVVAGLTAIEARVMVRRQQKSAVSGALVAAGD